MSESDFQRQLLIKSRFSSSSLRSLRRDRLQSVFLFQFAIFVFHHAAFIALLLCFITVQIKQQWNHKATADPPPQAINPRKDRRERRERRERPAAADNTSADKTQPPQLIKETFNTTINSSFLRGNLRIHSLTTNLIITKSFCWWTNRKERNSGGKLQLKTFFLFWTSF